MSLRVVCFVAMLALTGSADLGEATPAELTAVGQEKRMKREMTKRMTINRSEQRRLSPRVN